MPWSARCGKYWRKRSRLLAALGGFEIGVLSGVMLGAAGALLWRFIFESQGGIGRRSESVARAALAGVEAKAT